MRLDGRGIIVTGGGSGIGRAISLRCAGEGAHVVVADIDAAAGRETIRLIEVEGGQAHFVQADVTRAEDVRRLVDGGRIDGLVNNAAVGGGDDILSVDEVDWDRILAIVLKSVFLCSKAVLPLMLEQGRGAIVNIASVNGMTGLGSEAYGAAKAGVINLSQNLAVRYGSRGVRTNVVSPGTVRTPIWDARVAERPDIFERLAAWYPLGRVGEPNDIAAAVAFLLSDDAAFVNGAVLPVDGGLMAGSYRMARELQGE
jgi:NAD(P)-dependent dehydrogenase (short-subunit alcohol dehydrogenase family)